MGQKAIDWHQKLTYQIIVCLVWVEDTRRTNVKKNMKNLKLYYVCLNMPCRNNLNFIKLILNKRSL